MGRIHAFPAAFATVHPRYRSPVFGIVGSFVASLAVALGLGFGYGPVTGFAMVATGLVIALAAVYIIVNAACIGYFPKRRRGWIPYCTW